MCSGNGNVVSALTPRPAYTTPCCSLGVSSACCIGRHSRGHTILSNWLKPQCLHGGIEQLSGNEYRALRAGHATPEEERSIGGRPCRGDQDVNADVMCDPHHIFPIYADWSIAAEEGRNYGVSNLRPSSSRRRSTVQLGAAPTQHFRTQPASCFRYSFDQHCRSEGFVGRPRS